MWSKNTGIYTRSEEEAMGKKGYTKTLFVCVRWQTSGNLCKWWRPSFFIDFRHNREWKKKPLSSLTQNHNSTVATEYETKSKFNRLQRIGDFVVESDKWKHKMWIVNIESKILHSGQQASCSLGLSGSGNGKTIVTKPIKCQPFVSTQQIFTQKKW